MNNREKFQAIVLGVTTLCAIAWVAMTEVRIDRLERELKVKRDTPYIDNRQAMITAGAEVIIGGRGELRD